jgi:signal transduction histidine kinase
MSPRDDLPPSPYTAARNQIQHDLLSPLTIISGRAQLLARLVRRSSSLTERERGALLEGMAIIQDAVRIQAVCIDTIGCGNPDTRVHDGMAVPRREAVPE